MQVALYHKNVLQKYTMPPRRVNKPYRLDKMAIYFSNDKAEDIPGPFIDGLPLKAFEYTFAFNALVGKIMYGDPNFIPIHLLRALDATRGLVRFGSANSVCR